MSIVTSKNKISQNTINSGNLNQLDQVFNSKSEPGVGERNFSSATEVEIKSVTKQKREYKDTVLLNLPKGERNVFKSFCAQMDITMTDFIYFAMDYIKDGVEQGKFSVTRSGIKEINNSQI